MNCRYERCKNRRNIKKNELFEILNKYDKITYNESPFKSIISDIRSILPKKGFKIIKKGPKYAEEIKELTSLQIENFKNNLTKLRNDLTEKFRKNNRIKKADKDCYEHKNNKFYGLKDIRNLFDQNDDIYDTEYLFNENGLEYEEIKKLMSVKAKKEYVSEKNMLLLGELNRKRLYIMRLIIAKSIIMTTNISKKLIIFSRDHV